MRISDAMREGAKKGKQLFNENHNSQGDSCAAGAVDFGGGAYLLSGAGFIPAECPYSGCMVDYTNGPINFTKRRPNNLVQVIVHLNNDHRWTRENIATWVELTFEEPLPDRKIAASEVMGFIGEPLVEAVVR